MDIEYYFTNLNKTWNVSNVSNVSNSHKPPGSYLENNSDEYIVVDCFYYKAKILKKNLKNYNLSENDIKINNDMKYYKRVNVVELIQSSIDYKKYLNNIKNNYVLLNIINLLFGENYI
jgi:hypothetical protein